MTNNKSKIVSIVVPVFNESTNIIPLLTSMESHVPMGYDYEVIFVDDGSIDDTLNVLKHATFREWAVSYLSFSRNFGHQNALKAGLETATGDCIITMDGDLQHPPEIIPSMIEKWEQGFDVIYTRRSENKQQGLFKRLTSKRFYQLMRFISGLNMEEGIADFRLVNRRVADTLCGFSEHDLFLRGVIKWLGFSQYAIDYAPASRFSGKTKYSGKKMAKLALQGITSFSVKPLYMSIILGIFFFVLSLTYIPYVVWCVITGQAVPGWASIIITIMFFGGLQMLMLGIIGIYIGKIFISLKNRPGYIIKETNIKLKT